MNFFLYIFIILLLSAALYDLSCQKIPNIMNGGLIVIALLYQSLSFGLSGLLLGAAGLCIGIALLFIPFAFGGMGAGDVKMMGAVGAALGPQGVFVAFLYTALLGGLWALALLMANRFLLKSLATDVKATFLTRSLDYMPKQTNQSVRLSYGVVIALGAIIYIGLDFFGRQLIPL